jgi:hypothetical protein
MTRACRPCVTHLRRLGLTLDEVRVNFVLSGDQKSAIGQWAVLNGAGQIAGLYDATFIQRKKAWKLTRLQWTGDSIGFRPPRQFCHAPDDVMPHRLARARVCADSSGRGLGQGRSAAGAG